jgi:pimeloyl-ACP methyl ester carboxylesterase
MTAAIPFLCLLLTAEPVDTCFVQVAPLAEVAAVVNRSDDQERAVVLLHGLRVHPFSSRKVRQADFQAWQEPGSRLVDTLAAEADVYAFAYSQNADLETIAAEPALAEHVQALHAAGYRQVVLVGHSAGGLIARQFVEDHPNAGVTKVIQVCSPNGGSSWGKLTLGVRECQEPFLESLTKDARRAALERREDKCIPEHVEFACLVGRMSVDLEADLGALLGGGRDLRLSYSSACGDCILSLDSQWPADLQQQGIPAYPLPVAHFTAMFTRVAARRLVELVVEPQPRWTADEVAAAQRAAGVN